ncbi:MAG: hypothetical protein TUN42_08040 [Dehalogenimonas sp.]
MTRLLFHPELFSSDKSYLEIRDGIDNDYAIFIKERLESLWQNYEPFADPDFPKKFAEDIHSRTWEMYLTCFLLEHGLPVKKKTHTEGPDILIEQDNSRIFIEAVAPSPGDEFNPDRVPDMNIGEMQRIPEEQIILRYRSAIEGKCAKYLNYLAQELLSPTDAYIIAVNSCKIDSAIAELFPPKIMKALFPIGNHQIKIDKKTSKFIGEGYKYRGSVKKVAGAEISTNIFLDNSYSYISGILYSRASVRTFPEMVGDDFIFVHNPLAINPVHKKFIPCSKEFVANKDPDSWQISQL